MLKRTIQHRFDQLIKLASKGKVYNDNRRHYLDIETAANVLIKPSKFIIYLFLALLMMGLVQPHLSDFIAYRFAANLLTGRGLLYWTSDPQISTYPFVPTLIAVLSQLTHLDIVTAGKIIAI